MLLLRQHVPLALVLLPQMLEFQLESVLLLFPLLSLIDAVLFPLLGLFGKFLLFFMMLDKHLIHHVELSLRLVRDDALSSNFLLDLDLADGPVHLLSRQLLAILLCLVQLVLDLPHLSGYILLLRSSEEATAQDRRIVIVVRRQDVEAAEALCTLGLT